MDEIIEVLSKVMSRQEAKVLLYLAEKESASGMDIEVATHMRQPQMCVATNNLMEKGLVKSHAEAEKGHKGRPKLIFTINKEKTKDWLLSASDERKKELKEIEDTINKLF